MRRLRPTWFAPLALGVALAAIAAAPAPPPPSQEFRQQLAPVNPNIDMEGYLRVARAAAKFRESRRLTEEDFLSLMREPGTVVLDARSREKYDELHVKGAVNLSFPDIAIESLARVLPDKRTRILIYCNNNFRGAEGPFPSKLPSASLNLSTFIALYNYGYRDLWELGPQIDVKDSKLPFESGPTK